MIHRSRALGRLQGHRIPLVFRLGVAAAVSAAVLVACGGGNGEAGPASAGSGASSPAPAGVDPAASAAPVGAASTALASMPFWSTDTPIRPSLQHLVSPQVSAHGAVISLDAAQSAQVRQRAAAVREHPERALSREHPMALAVQRRVVTGIWSDTVHSESGSTSIPFDLGAYGVQAIVPSPAGGFEVIAASSARSDGSYLINDVPEGPYWLKMGHSYVWSDASHIDWGSDSFGRSDVLAATAATPLLINAGNLESWQAGDVLAWIVPAQGTSLALPLTSSALSNVPNPGDTALADLGIDFGPGNDSLFLGLLDAGQGDHASLNQLSARTAAGIGYRALSRSLVMPALTMSSGTPASVVSGFIDVPQSAALNLRWDRQSYADLAAAVNPGAVASSSVVASSAFEMPPMYGPPGAAFSLFEFDSFGVADIDFGQLHYGNPFPADWHQEVDAYMGFTLQYLAPGATVPIAVQRYITSSELVDLSVTEPALHLQPRVTPARSPLINGKSLFSNQLAIGVNPTVTWAAPAIGEPSQYLLRVWKLTAEGSRTATLGIASFYTAQTSVTLPPDVLEFGSVYFLTLSAIQGGSVTAPRRSALPFAFGTLMTAIVSP